MTDRNEPTGRIDGAHSATTPTDRAALEALRAEPPADVAALVEEAREHAARVTIDRRYADASFISRLAAAVTAQAERADRAEAELKLLQQDARMVVPGVMRCAKCSFVLHRVTLHTMDGSASAGDNRSEPCPNGCGPLWPMTWKRQARELQKRLEALLREAPLQETVARTIIERCAQVADQHAARAAARCRPAGEGGDCAIEDRARKEAGLIASSIRALADKIREHTDAD